MSDPADKTESARTSGWERADAVASGAGQVVHGIGWVLTKGYAVLLIIVGIVLFAVAAATAWWVALILIAYGLYLILPGSKFVVW